MPDARPACILGVRAATAALVAVLGLAACGGGDDETTSAATRHAEATEATASESTNTAPTPTSTTTEQLEVDALRQDFNEQLRRVLTRKQGLTPSQADCAIEELQGSLTDEALRQVAETGQPSDDLIDAAFAAGAACKDE